MRIRESLSALITFLSHPLVIVGAIVALFFGFQTELIESGVLPELRREDAAPVVHKLLDYGLIIGLAVIALGFGLQFYKLHRGIPLRASASEEANELARRNRQRMLGKVRHMWVEGVLERSLYQVARIELGLSERPEAIEHPWKLVVEQPEHAPRALPAGTPMRVVFEQFDQSLLLLGVPGSGKTTLLLELARDLIEQAKEDPAYPIPVVFNLSSWALQRPSITDWLADELSQRYDVPRKIAEAWIQNDQVLPLLDGLDEVALKHRDACVEAINAFRNEHGLLPLMVCCRRADYEALSTHLRLPGAVTIQPLSRAQIEQYLTQSGMALSGINVALRQDETLWELLDTPLMLSMMGLAFQGVMEAGVRIARLKGGLEKGREALFDTYIEAMFKRRKVGSTYAPERTRHWLSWLAKAMIGHDQTVFYLERLQPDWLPEKWVWMQTAFWWLAAG